MIEETNKSKNNSTKPTRARRTTSKVGVKKENTTKRLKEDTILKVYKSHIIIKSNMIKPNMLFNYLGSDDLFVCDFKNKDYFWLNELVRWFYNIFVLKLRSGRYEI